MKTILLIPALCAMFVACNNNSTNRNGDSDDYSNGNSQMQADATRKSDAEITAKVKRTIMADGSLSASARMISVSTSDGVVTLNGTVASKEESRKIVRMANDVPGVASVVNQLMVSNS